MRLNIKNIEEKVKPLAGKDHYDKNFIFDLLAAYGRASGNITRLRNGQLNVANDKDSEVAQKRIVYFKPTTENVYSVIDELQTDPTVVRYSTRFVIVTDFKKLLAFDTKTNEPLDIEIVDIDKHFTFFLPWAGMEKAQYANENHADVKAAEKMAKLFDELNAYNKGGDAKYYHGLNVFFMRLLFCYFAEDTLTFKQGQFTKAIESLTQHDGSDVASVISELFVSLDIEDKTGYPEYIKDFPYVNGSLFRGSHLIPQFNRAARDLLLGCGKLNWSNINPDIFGSMIQAVVNPGQRAGLGMHYTSVPNILKTIEPLFLDELKEEFNNSFDDSKKLEKILGRIGMIKIFDPACGSGNFLIIAYKELRKLEHAILERQGQLGSMSRQLFSRINIEHFYGIEIDDFAHEVAMLSLWLAKHQMNLEFREKFGIEIPLIPLKEAGHIVLGNATRLDWNKICPNNGKDVIYLIGNPPYQGSKLQDKSQKDDYGFVLGSQQYSRNLDYISLWFIKGAQYIACTNAQLAFVATNSVTQGEHVGLLFPKLFKLNLEIGFAYTSFKWENNAKNNAGVTVVVIGLRNKTKSQKYIYANGLRLEAANINGYLVDSSSDIYIERCSKPISDIPQISFGSMPIDGGHFMLSLSEKNELQKQGGGEYIKEYTGSAEFIRGINRWCIWVEEVNILKAQEIPFIKKRMGLVRKFRAESKRKETVKLASAPYSFGFISYRPTSSIIIPSVSSERYKYIPIGFVDKNTVISNAAFAIYNAEPYVFGLISSRMHMVWVRAVAGRLKTDIRYSSAIVYNNYPVPSLTEEMKKSIEKKVFSVLDARENHTEMTLGEMYNPEKMPDDLRLAHIELDQIVDNIYSKKPLESDEDRLACLFELYEEMTITERKPK